MSGSLTTPDFQIELFRHDVISGDAVTRHASSGGRCFCEQKAERVAVVKRWLVGVLSSDLPDLPQISPAGPLWRRLMFHHSLFHDGM
ncbi:hypothetical protein RRG08_049985 [Elysia crispata]|uniref:Uncharacterized protein n=1 Tax=Elysia crispata TaxID=231223 RepID=A0AAE1ECY3_9GAST|nr:hypothetical protein RRG08_049985 [Elysia crispata]